MKKLLILIAYVLMMSKVMSYGQVCIDIDNSSVSSSALYVDGRQLHTLELDLIHDGSTTIDFIATCTNGTILGPNSGSLLPNTPTAVTIEVLLDANSNEANIAFSITSGQPNSCPNSVYIIPVPSVEVCLDITQASEVNCYIDNDGIGYDGEVHVYEIGYFNNSPGLITFDLTSNNFIIPYNRQSLGAFESASFTYLIYVDPSNRTSDLSNKIQGLNLSNGCATPIGITFPACNQAVCLQSGPITFDGCTGPDANGDYLYTYNLEVSNQSNIPLDYTVASPTGSFAVGGSSRTLQANTTETISFDYMPSTSNATQWSYNLIVNTPNVINQCASLTTLTLPSCANQYGNLQILVFYDQNNNGVKDQNEPPLSGRSCAILLQGGGQLLNGTTNASGQILFTGLTPGLYLVNQDVPFPWTANPSGGSLNNVLVQANQNTDIEFANTHPNANIDPITILNLEGTCAASGNNNDSTYIYSGFISTSFFDASELSITDLNGGHITNIAVGTVPSLAQALPFSFQYSGHTDPCFQFRLATILTLARDTICTVLPICCSPDTTIVNNRMSISVDHGAFLPVANSGIRIAEIIIQNILSCTDSITLSNPNNSLLFNGIYVVDGDTVLVSNATMPFTFHLPPHTKNLNFYIDENTGSGLLILASYGCGIVNVDSVFVGQNFGSNVASLVQTTPSFTNVYGASFGIKLANNAKAKYITFGLPNFSTDTKFLGATGGDYFYFKRDATLASITNVRNDNAHIHLVLDDNSTNDNKTFNVFYTGSSKAIDVSYTIYDSEGTKLGIGSITLDGSKVITNISDTKVENENLTIYPLPAQDVLNIKYGDDIIQYDYKIYSENGVLQKYGQCMNSDSIDITQLHDGIYTIVLKNKTKQQKANFIKI